MMKTIFKKNRFIFLSILLGSVLLLAGCTSSKIPSAENLPHSIVLSSFKLHLASFDQSTFNSGNYANLLVALREKGSSSADLTQIYRTYSTRQNKIINDDLDSVYTAIQQSFKHSGMNLMNKGALSGKDVEYDPYGFPMSSKFRSNISGTGADAAVTFHLYLHAQNIDIYPAGPNQNGIQYQPKLIMTMKMVDSDGHVIWNDEATTTASTQVELLETTVGVRTIHVQQQPSLKEMVSDAVNQMLDKLNQKGNSS